MRNLREARCCKHCTHLLVLYNEDVLFNKLVCGEDGEVLAVADSINPESIRDADQYLEAVVKHSVTDSKVCDLYEPRTAYSTSAWQKESNFRLRRS